MTGRGWTAGGVALACAAAVGGVAIGAGGGNGDGDARAAVLTGTATVERGDLVERETVSGTLGYADSSPVVGGGDGTVTRLPAEGSVVRRGESLYELDGQRTAFVLYGARPLWRALSAGIADGEDIRQLERNLVRLGYHPGTVDDDWSSSTTSAVNDFQDDRGLSRDGALAAGEVVFRRGGAVRIGELKVAVGEALRPGAPVLVGTSTRREVTVPLEATLQDLVRVGDRVTVDLPSGDRARGRISEVAAVATAGEEGAPATIEVHAELRGKAARRSGFDRAPVDVGLVRGRADDVLTVPVTALVAKAGGGFAVELPGGRLLAVEPGIFADDRVEVTGAGLREGMAVVVPR